MLFLLLLLLLIISISSVVIVTCYFFSLAFVIHDFLLLTWVSFRGNVGTSCCFWLLIYLFNSIIFFINSYKFSGLAAYTNICDNLSTLFSSNLYTLLFLSTYYVNYRVILPYVTNLRWICLSLFSSNIIC